MAFVNYPAEYDKMLEKLKNDPGNWIKITLQDVVAEQKVSNHMARNLLTIIRYDNNVRYRLMDGSDLRNTAGLRMRKRNLMTPLIFLNSI